MYVWRAKVFQSADRRVHLAFLRADMCLMQCKVGQAVHVIVLAENWVLQEP